MKEMLQKKDYLVLYALLSVVYISGLFIILMENDAAQHATMAMQMHLNNDFFNLYKAEIEYLDKPHLHFWLAALSYKLFGISHIAYRIPSLLFTIIGAISCFNLAKIFYGKTASHLAALIFLSSQAIILANHDVRTDAVLTGATILSIWQLVLYVEKQKLLNIILGCFGLGLAFSSKGQLGVFVIGICLMTHLFYTKKWKILWSWKILVGILLFVVTIFPVLYAYYNQFDLHPEKIIQGRNNISGVKFILWDQSFNRLTAEGFNETSPDYLFFFHTLLWAFLPWSLITYLALFNRIKKGVTIKFKYTKNFEILTSIGVFIILIVISFSKFKLPHYLNSLLPILSVLVAGYLIELYHTSTKWDKLLFYVQISVMSLLLLGLALLIFWAFQIQNFLILIVYLLFIGVLFIYFTATYHPIKKLIVLSVSIMAFVNICLNTHFYPNLILHQAGNNIAKILKQNNISTNKVFTLNTRRSWSLSFYSKQLIKAISSKKLEKEIKNGDWLFIYEDQLQELEKYDLVFTEKIDISHYRVTRLKMNFLNPNTRDQTLEKAYFGKVLFTEN